MQYSVVWVMFIFVCPDLCLYMEADQDSREGRSGASCERAGGASNEADEHRRLGRAVAEAARLGLRAGGKLQAGRQPSPSRRVLVVV